MVFRAILFTLALFSGVANAGFIETDWKTQGDRLAILEQETGLEWLDLTQTKNKTFNQVMSELDTTYAGWRLPTVDELRRLMSNYFSSVNVESGRVRTGDINVLETFEKWVSELGSPSSTNNYALGMYIDANGVLRVTGVYRPTPSSSPELYGLGFTSVYNPNVAYRPQGTGQEVWGTFLVSDGGTTLTSINDPMLNINNPAAPVNQNVSDVSAAFPMLSGALLMLLGLFSRKINRR